MTMFNILKLNKNLELIFVTNSKHKEIFSIGLYNTIRSFSCSFKVLKAYGLPNIQSDTLYIIYPIYSFNCMIGIWCDLDLEWRPRYTLDVKLM